MTFVQTNMLVDFHNESYCKSITFRKANIMENLICLQWVCRGFQLVLDYWCKMQEGERPNFEKLASKIISNQGPIRTRVWLG